MGVGDGCMVGAGCEGGLGAVVGGGWGESTGGMARRTNQRRSLTTPHNTHNHHHDRQIAHALVSKREYLQPFLHLMLRDDILGWQMSKTNKVRVWGDGIVGGRCGWGWWRGVVWGAGSGVGWDGVWGGW